jgi:hypothetical protein
MFLTNVMQKYPFIQKLIDPDTAQKKRIFQQKIGFTRKINYKLNKIVFIQKYIRVFLAYSKWNAYKKHPVKKIQLKPLTVKKYKKKSLKVSQLIKLQLNLRRFLLIIKMKKYLAVLIAKDKMKHYLMKKNFNRWHRNILKIKVILFSFFFIFFFF